MKKTMGLVFIIGIMLNASAAFATYGTAFSRAAATWQGLDQSGAVVATYSSTWTSTNSAESCGTNCKVYRVWTTLPVNTDNWYPYYKVSRLYARVFKDGTDATEEYIFSDWDYLNIGGSWGSEDYSSDYISGDGRLYYSYRYYSYPYLPVKNTDYEVRINYSYTSSVSGERRIDFNYAAVG